MSDVSSESRRLIDEVFADGRMTRRRQGRGRQPDPAIAERRRAVLALCDGARTIPEIAAAVGIGHATVRGDINWGRREIGWEFPIRKLRAGSKGDVARRKREARAVSARDRVIDRRRFKVAAVATGEPALLLDPDAPAVTEARTQFPDRVFEIGEEAVLKDGSSNAKIGGDVLVGHLRDAKIFTLTLEERATCPRSCPLWRGCYGNSMAYSRRWRPGPQLEARIEEEIADLCARYPLVLIRLHVLGDFYSVDYALTWAVLLRRYPGLHIFGFTARRPGEDAIGDAIGLMREDFGLRFAMRESGRGGSWGTFTVDFPTNRKRIGDAVVCPEQREAVSDPGQGRHCGNCAVCWSSDAPVAFWEH